MPQFTDTIARRTLAAFIAAAGLSVAPSLAGHPGEDGHEHAVEMPSEQELLKGRLLVGDAAPALNIEKWVKGQPVTGFEKGKVYVVEFWATWCPPCRDSIPHLTKLQDKYADQGLTIIGVSSERGGLEKIEPFVAEWGERMDYVVAFDDGRKTSTSYMTATGQNGIPHAYIVDREGRLAWHGHPMQMDAPLEQIVKGNWNTERFAKTKRAEALRGAMRDHLMPRAEASLTAAREAYGAGDMDKTIALLGDVVSLSREAFADIAMSRMQLLFTADRAEEANAEANRLASESLTKYPDLLNQFAWMLATMDNDKVDLKPALSAAKRAVEMTNEEDPDIIDTLARVHYEMGEVDKAIEWQSKAVEMASGEAAKAQYRETLEGYKAGRG